MSRALVAIAHYAPADPRRPPYPHVLSLRFESGAVVVETARPDEFYTTLTALAASGEFGTIEEVTAPDDNLQAVFSYLVK